LEEIKAGEEQPVTEKRGLVGSMVGRRRVAITGRVGEAWETYSPYSVEVV